ncbi:MAG: DUF4340 domain-containing protein [Ruminococcaceae bacterium]|nr:DUF4340 domain-containing protein [Oscillospiraceae bacterium]
MAEFEKEPLEQAEESTIFSAPEEHIDKGKKSKFSLAKKIIAAVLAVAIIATGTVLVVKLIPEKTVDPVEMNEGVTFLNVPTTEIKKVTVKHENATLVIVADKDEEGEDTFILEGYDRTLVDSASLSQIVGYVSNMVSYEQYTLSSLEQYGLDKPVVEATVEGGGAEQSYTVKFGNKTGDGQYCYLLLSTEPETVYLVQAGVVSGLTVMPLDLAIATIIPAVEKNDKNAGYFNSEGTLDTFDSLTISGTKFNKTLVFKPNKDGLFNDFANYICTSPLLRMANGVEDILDVFANGVASSSAVSYDQSAQSLKKFGLDKPMWVITLRVAGVDYTYKITPTDSDMIDFFVASSTDKMIRTVPITKLAFLENEEKDFYFGFMAVETIQSIKSFKLSGKVNATFDVLYDSDNEEYNISVGDKQIKAEDFQDFYAEFVQTTAIDFNTVSTSKKPETVVTIVHNDGSDDTVISFTKISDTRYQYSVGANPMGQIPATAYERILKLAGKLIP